MKQYTMVGEGGKNPESVSEELALSLIKTAKQARDYHQYSKVFAGVETDCHQVSCYPCIVIRITEGA